MKQKNRRNIRKYIAAGVVTALLTASISAIPYGIRASLPQVTAMTVKGETLVETVSCTGTLEAESSKNLYTATGIMVDEVYVKNGQHVNAGDPLFSVDREVTVSLWVSAAEKEEASENRVSALLDGLLDDYFSTSVGNIFSSFSEETESDNTSYSDELLVIVPDIITASEEGIISSLSIKDNTYADGSSPLLRICDTSSMFVRCELSESFASSLKEGLFCNVTGEGFEKSYTAAIVEISPIAKAVSGGSSYVECMVEIDFPDSSLKAGYTADVEIELSRKNDALALPYSAVMQDEVGEYVWELYGSRAYRRDIVTGTELVDRIEILSGIDSGAFIVTETDKPLKEGKPVRIKSS